MKREAIRDYVSKYKNQYSKQSIINQLVSHGAKKDEVELVFQKLKARPSQNTNKPPSIFLILFFVMFVFAFLGILIFSVLTYVDFETTLPNKLDLSNNLIGVPSSMIYNTNNNELILVTVSVGPSRFGVLLENSQVTIDNSICSLKNIRNDDTSAETPEEVQVLNGQTLIFTFDCSSLENKKSGDILEGEINIVLENSKTEINIPSTGTFRLSVR